MSEGRVLDERYEIQRELGSGSTGQVLLARDLMLEREVAIKLIVDEDESQQVEMGLRRQVTQVSNLNHPNIATIFDFGRDDSSLFLVMPLLRGRSLRELVAQGPLPIPLVAEIGRQVALALAHSHSAGVVHRDIKPENLMLTLDEGDLQVKVLDFGLASVVADGRRRDRRALDEPAATATPYAAPEQLRGAATDLRIDLYALGVVLYEALVGRPPFVGDSRTLEKAIREDPPVRPGLLRTELPGELDLLVLELLAKDPTRRPGNARDVADRLHPYADGSAGPHLLTTPSRVRRSRAGESMSEARSAFLETALGRQEILRSIDSRLTLASTGELQLVLLAAEAGMGKTAVLDELSLSCQQRGIEMLRTRADADSGRLGPFGELLTAGLARRPQAVGELARDAADLVELFPSLDRDRLGELARTREPSKGLFSGLDDDDVPRPRQRPRSEPVRAVTSRTLTPRERVDMVVVRAMAALASRRPLVLTIDDAHLCGETVELVELLFRRLVRAPLMLVVAHQLRELPIEHPLQRLHLRLASHPRCLAAELDPLPEEVHAALLVQMLGGGEPEPGLAHRLFRESGGRPLYARELIRTALEAGVLVQRDGVWHLDAANWPMPRSIQAAVINRLRELPQQLLSSLRTSSVLAVGDGSFDFDELAELQGWSRDELELVLEQGLRLGLLSDQRRAGRVEFEFTSALVHRILHQDVPVAARRKFHRHCARRLQRKFIRNEEDPIHQDLLLAHLIEAELLDEARPLIVALAQRALDQGRPERALPKLSALLEVADALPVVDRAELHLLRAELEVERDETQAATSSLLRLATTLDEAEDTRLDRFGTRGAELADALGRRELADRLLGQGPQDRRIAEHQRRTRVELAALRPASRSRSMAIGDLLLMHDDDTGARRKYESARQRAAAAGDADEEARQLQKLARVASKLGHYETALAYCREGLELLSARRSLERIGLWAQAALAHCAAGQLERAYAETEAGSAELATYPRSREPAHLRVAFQLEHARGTLLIARGQGTQAVAAYERCLALGSESDRWDQSIARYNLGEACALAGQAQRAIREFERAAADKRAIGDRWGLARTHTAQARVLRDLGQITRASDLLAAAGDLADELEEPRLFAQVHTELGRHALLSGNFVDAAAEARRSRDMANRVKAAAELAGAEELLGEIAILTRALADARRCATRAIAAAELHNLGNIHISALLVLAEASPRERQGELLAEARQVAAALGNPYRELDVALTTLRLSLGESQDAGDEFVAIEGLMSRAEELEAKRHVGLCLLAKADVLAPHDLRGALDTARLAEAKLRNLGARLEADRAGEFAARLALDDRNR